jgi:hypothetical protein
MFKPNLKCFEFFQIGSTFENMAMAFETGAKSKEAKRMGKNVFGHGSSR